MGKVGFKYKIPKPDSNQTKIKLWQLQIHMDRHRANDPN